MVFCILHKHQTVDGWMWPDPSVTSIGGMPYLLTAARDFAGFTRGGFVVMGKFTPADVVGGRPLMQCGGLHLSGRYRFTISHDMEFTFVHDKIAADAVSSYASTSFRDIVTADEAHSFALRFE